MTTNAKSAEKCGKSLLNPLTVDTAQGSFKEANEEYKAKCKRLAVLGKKIASKSDVTPV